MSNLDLYDRVRAVPPEAQKQIGGGKLKGMTDINPMWRIKKLTEEFGECGKGWYTDDERYWIAPVDGQGTVGAFCTLNLYVKYGNEWSKPIAGIGGSMYIAIEKGQLVMNDECFKMARTDALSVACKSLGFGADVYFSKDRTKYDAPADELGDDFTELPPAPPAQPAAPKPKRFTDEQLDALNTKLADGSTLKEALAERKGKDEKLKYLQDLAENAFDKNLKHAANVLILML